MLELAMVKPRIRIEHRSVFLRLLVILCVATASSLSAKKPLHAVAPANPVLLVHGFQDDAKNASNGACPAARGLDRSDADAFAKRRSGRQ